ncbi:MAG: ribosome recycling factor [Ignavibacteria bacterium GWB2_35_12]|nr:MAG: ribosome recycling factor [Ignavibacteria bacterium GWA2_35_8]OGU42005.1 MAG: ribosome recycling factor [Ignavibacteria bacterium GWB2_35_12]OGU96100.1 MAG: ribosome recycling factor [Ignavibacteria bacterium RIFOXYA2_FULL_35_10]OGV24474.1 MAG: ribosome recycling factor [Ignavibacteria bacterium RIFOXYC2_FULL_35_21]
MKEILSKTRDAMSKSVEFFKSQLAKVRTGRASSTLVDNVKADYYGAATPIPQMATISVPDARTIVIQPWDRSTLTAIEKAIQSADLGFNPQNDGTIIRIPVPPLTEERRKEFVKVCKKYAEEGKIALRNIRREQNDVLKKAEKDKQMSEDDSKWGEEEIQKIITEYTKKIDESLDKKEKELMEG